jgi:hypothetical protein
MSKPLKEYFQKEKEKDIAYLNCRIDKDIYDKLYLYKEKFNKTWTELLEAIFLKVLEEEFKGKQK